MFLGRVDHQVKLRGGRLEMGEIEAQLSGNPLVRDAVVLVREFGAEDQRLVAYVTLHAGVPTESEHATTLARLREPLTRILPANAVPAHFVVMEGLPLTANGKADRQLLGALPVVRTSFGVQAPAVAIVEPPLNNLEPRLRTAWAAVLGVEAVGDDDDFVELGGHSLLAVTLIARLRKEFGLKVAIGELFEKRTVKAMAELMRARAAESTP